MNKLTNNKKPYIEFTPDEVRSLRKIISYFLDSGKYKGQEKKICEEIEKIWYAWNDLLNYFDLRSDEYAIIKFVMPDTVAKGMFEMITKYSGCLLCYAKTYDRISFYDNVKEILKGYQGGLNE